MGVAIALIGDNMLIVKRKGGVRIECVDRLPQTTAQEAFASLTKSFVV